MKNEMNLTMLTDFYEFTMMNGFFAEGYKDKIAYFDMFFRRVPEDGGFAIMAGVEQIIEYIKEILLGIEEEGIPYQVEDKQFGSAVEIAHEASLESTLGVGIGIDNNYIVLHYNKLKEESPIFKIKFISEDKQKRSLGANAARLVTRMPFKEIENLG